MTTHSADELWGPRGCGLSDASTWETSHARERSAEPLTAKSAGSLFEVAWRNASGDPYVTQSRSILEVRVFLSLSCADPETSNKLAADWERFKLANKTGSEQHYWATVDVKTTLRPASQFEKTLSSEVLKTSLSVRPFAVRSFALSGVPCFLGRCYYGAFCICGLGWLYRLWYSTRKGVVEMHLHRELSIGGFGDEANRTRETDRTAESSAGRQLGTPVQPEVLKVEEVLPEVRGSRSSRDAGHPDPFSEQSFCFFLFIGVFFLVFFVFGGILFYLPYVRGPAITLIHFILVVMYAWLLAWCFTGGMCRPRSRRVDNVCPRRGV